MILTQTSDQGTFSGARGLQLFYQSWYPSDLSNPVPPLKGVLTIIHGLGEHSGRYRKVVAGLTRAGYAVFGFDNLGHGKSEGQRGHIQRWEDYRENVQAFLALIRQQEPSAPLFVMGHSLGGLILLDYILRSNQDAAFQSFDIQGLIVSAPPVKPAKGTASQGRILLARLLSGLFPRMTVEMKLCGASLSRDSDVAMETLEDPLTHPYVTLRWGSETLAALNWVKENIHRLRLPVLLTHGGADSIMSPEGSQQIFEQMTSADKTLKIYSDSYHEPHNDLDAAQVVADMVDWLDQRRAGATQEKV